jgi:hypothetical protein
MKHYFGICRSPISQIHPEMAAGWNLKIVLGGGSQKKLKKMLP